MRDWTKEEVAQAMFEWAYEHGEPPTTTDWKAQTIQHPSEYQVRWIFGTWNDALEECGYPRRRMRRAA